MRRAPFGSLILNLVVVAGLLVGAGALYVGARMNAPGPAQTEIAFTVPEGAGMAGIAAALGRAGAVADPRLFRWLARFRGAERSLQAGDYVLPAGASVAQILTIITEGRAAQHRFTVPEGWSHKQILAALEAETRLSGAVERLPAEGWLAPDTYYFRPGQPRQSLIDLMADEQRERVEALWPERAGGLPIRTPEEAVILASIIEKETGVDGERRRVAAVFINRLNRRPAMRLQADSTLVYGVGGGMPLGRGLRVSELEDRDAPYNTYRRGGLPPTAIANPGRAALAAALDPAETNDLYFVADGTGGHVFAETLAEHNRNVARWRRIEQGQEP